MTTFAIFAPMTNNHKIIDYDAILDAKFGKEGTPERARAEEAAYSFYSGQILQDARKEAKMTQSELAERTQTTKSYRKRRYHPKCRCFLPYHCSPRNEGGSGEACVLSIQNLCHYKPNQHILHWTC